MLKGVKKNTFVVLVLMMLFSVGITGVKASTLEIGGSSTINVGSSADFSFNVVGNNGSVSSSGGSYSVADTSCVRITAYTPAGGAATSPGPKFAYANISGNTASSFSVAKVTITAGSNPCTTTLNITNGKVTYSTGTTDRDLTASKTIQVVSPTPSKSTNNNLASLSVDGFNLSPSFSAGTTSYSITVPHTTDSINVKATAADSGASVTGIGSASVPSGGTTINVKVTAPSGDIKTYTIKVNKEAAPAVDNPPQNEDPKPAEPDTPKLSNNATLQSLNVSGYTLNPVFSPDKTSYTMNVNNTVTGLDVAAVAADPKATVTVTGNNGWVEGPNTISILVTAEDGTTKTYSVNVIRAKAATDDNKPSTNNKNNKKSNDASLKKLDIVSDHSIDQKFSPDIYSYSITVPSNVEKLDLDYLTNNNKAKVKVEGNENFKVDEPNLVTITVTAEDGTEKYYFLNVTRTKEESKTNLKDLVITNGELSPKFDPEKTSYTVNVSEDTQKLDIKALPLDPESTVEIIGNKELKEGHNNVTIKVTDKNGISRYYELDVVKPEAKVKTFLGLPLKMWWTLLGVLSFFLLFILLLLLLLRKKKEEKEKTMAIPNIEIKPEFNFGSKNSSSTDDDVVYGNMNQESEVEYKNHEDDKKLIDVPYNEIEEEEDPVVANAREIPEIPYDPYDDVVTKEELVDALQEAMETKDPAKLKMLLDQEELNRRKEELKERERY